MKETICTIVGIVGSFIAGLFGGWDASMVTLLLFMGVDYITGSLRQVPEIRHRQTVQQDRLARSGTEMRLPAAGSGGGTPGYYPGHIVHPGRGVHRVYRQRADFHHGKCGAAGRTAAGNFDESN